MSSKIQIKLFPIALLFFVALTGRIWGKPITNLEVLKEASSQALSKGIRKIPNGKLVSPVLICSERENEANRLVESLLIEKLTNAGFKVKTNPDSGKTSFVQPATELSYSILDFKVCYLGEKGSLFGNGSVERQTKTKFFLRLSDPSTGEILWLDEVEAQIKDRFPKSQLPLVESGSYPFTKVNFEEKEPIEFLEPIIISVVIGGVVYLFYSSRF